MWEWMVAAAQSSAVQWTVLIAVAAAFALRIFLTDKDLMMSEMFHNDLDA